MDEKTPEEATRTVILAAELLARSHGSLVLGHRGIRISLGEGLLFDEPLFSVALSTTNRGLEIVLKRPLSKTTPCNSVYHRDDLGETRHQDPELHYIAAHILDSAARILSQASRAHQLSQVKRSSRS